MTAQHLIAQVTDTLHRIGPRKALEMWRAIQAKQLDNLGEDWQALGGGIGRNWAGSNHGWSEGHGWPFHSEG